MTLIYKEQISDYNVKIFNNYCTIDEKPDQDAFSFYTYETVKNGYFSIKDKLTGELNFVENYGNPFAGLILNRKTVVIEENENKIALKVYSYISSRGVGKKYFKVRKNITFLTFNIKRKQFFYGEINSKKKKKINNILKVNLPDISNTSLMSRLNIRENYFLNDDSISILDKFLDRVIEITGVKITEGNTSPFDKYYEMYLIFKKIKYPDAFAKFKSIYQPIKEIRNNDLNLVTYIMKTTGLKGKKAKTLINKYNNLDIDSMVNIQKWFGVDVFNRIQDKSFLTKSEYSAFMTVSYYEYEKPYFKKNDLECIVNIINTSTTEECLSTIMEHLNFKKELKKYGEHLKINANTYDEFVNEHSEWSSLLQSYKTGIINRFYGEDSKLVENQIFTNDHTYFPKLLKTSEEYEMESSIQHNCVRTYIEKPYCFIISLRKGSPNSNERATLEYRFGINGVNRVQSKAKYNKILTEEWDGPMSELDDYVNYLYVKGLLKLPVMTKKFINGKIMTSTAIFKNKEDLSENTIYIYPEWDESDLIQNILYDYDDLP